MVGRGRRSIGSRGMVGGWRRSIGSWFMVGGGRRSIGCWLMVCGHRWDVWGGFVVDRGSIGSRFMVGGGRGGVGGGAVGRGRGGVGGGGHRGEATKVGELWEPFHPLVRSLRLHLLTVEAGSPLQLLQLLHEVVGDGHGGPEEKEQGCHLKYVGLY
jgi:hypothetical protein